MLPAQIVTPSINSCRCFGLIFVFVCANYLVLIPHNKKKTKKPKTNWLIVSQLLIFVPFLVLDERRLVAKKNSCCPCCITHEDRDLTKQGMDEIHKAIQLRGTSDASKETTPDLGLPTTQDTKNSNKESNSTNSGKNTKNGIGQYFSFQVLIMKGLIPILGNKIGRIIIYVFFSVILIASAISLQWINTNADSTRLVPDDSFIIDFFDALDDGFGAVAFGEINFVIENRDFSDSTTMTQVHNMINAFETNFSSKYCAVVGDISQWLTDFEEWVENSTNVDIYSIDSATYYDYLQIFANDSENRAWDSEIVYDNDEQPTKIVATRVCLF